jgi:hypothetical protein
MSTTTNSAGQTQGDATISAGGLFRAGFIGGAISAVVNVVLLFGAGAAGVSLAGEFQPGQPAATLGTVPVLLASIVPAIPGALLALSLAKFASKKAALIFGIIAVLFTLVSLGGPANVKGLSTGGLVVMELMHVVAAAGIGGMLWRKLASTK